MLIIVKYRNIAQGLKPTLNLKTLRRFNIFKINTAIGTSNRTYGIDKSVDVLGIHQHIDRVNVGKALKQQCFTFHNGFAGQSSQVTQPQNGTSVRNNGNAVAFAGIPIGHLGIQRDLTAGFSNTGRVGHR